MVQLLLYINLIASLQNKKYKCLAPLANDKCYGGKLIMYGTRNKIRSTNE